MGQPFRLPADQVARICAHLLDYRWDWTVTGLDETLAVMGWAVRERESDRPFLRLTSRAHPLLTGLAGLLEPGDEVIDIVLGVTGSADELDGHGQAQLDGAAEIVWFSMALSDGAQWVLDSLGITRSEFQRD